MSDLPVIYGDNKLEVRRSMQWEEVEALCNTLGKITRCCAWWWGDTLNYIEREFPERWTQLIPSDLNPQTLRNWKWVSGRFPQESRDPSLPWSIFQAAAGVEDQQERLELIEQAKEQNLSCRAIRSIIRQKQGREDLKHEMVCPQCGFKWIISG